MKLITFLYFAKHLNHCIITTLIIYHATHYIDESSVLTRKLICLLMLRPKAGFALNTFGERPSVPHCARTCNNLTLTLDLHCHLWRNSVVQFRRLVQSIQLLLLFIAKLLPLICIPVYIFSVFFFKYYLVNQ